MRIKNSVQYEKQDESLPQLVFEHLIELNDDKLYFAFTYPYTYTMIQEDMLIIDNLSLNINMKIPDSIYCCRELIINSVDGLRIDLITITSVSGASTKNKREPKLPGLFPTKSVKSISVKQPDSSSSIIPLINTDLENTEMDSISVEIAPPLRPLIFPEKEIIFISARVHPGEVYIYMYCMILHFC